jgi:hypothetical protein
MHLEPGETVKLVLTALIVCALLISGIRYAFLIEAQFREYRDKEGSDLAIPRDGSLNGVDSAGSLIQPEPSVSDHREPPGYLVLFVIHRRDAANEIQFWNAVADSKPKLESASVRPVRFWGICDDGASCNPFASSAHFRVVGYLAPYQMHTVSKADLRHEVLLYDRHGALMAEQAQAQTPQAETALILQQVK